MTKENTTFKEDFSSKHRSQDSLQNLVKLILSLALAVLALSGTFASQLSKDIGWYILILILSWIFLILSIFFGIRAISTITQFIMNNTQNWWGECIKNARYSWNMFLAGIILIVIYGTSSGINNAFFTKQNNPKTYTLILANDTIPVVLVDSLIIEKN